MKLTNVKYARDYYNMDVCVAGKKDQKQKQGLKRGLRKARRNETKRICGKYSEIILLTKSSANPVATDAK